MSNEKVVMAVNCGDCGREHLVDVARWVDTTFGWSEVYHMVEGTLCDECEQKVYARHDNDPEF